MNTEQGISNGEIKNGFLSMTLAVKIYYHKIQMIVGISILRNSKFLVQYLIFNYA